MPRTIHHCNLFPRVQQVAQRQSVLAHCLQEPMAITASIKARPEKMIDVVYKKAFTGGHLLERKVDQ